MNNSSTGIKPFGLFKKVAGGIGGIMLIFSVIGIISTVVILKVLVGVGDTYVNADSYRSEAIAIADNLERDGGEGQGDGKRDDFDKAALVKELGFTEGTPIEELPKGKVKKFVKENRL